MYSDGGGEGQDGEVLKLHGCGARLSEDGWRSSERVQIVVLCM
jgi:hypothetical protein